MKRNRLEWGWLRLMIVVVGTLIGVRNASGHGVQLGYTTTPSGLIRVYIEHWHGDADPTTGTLNITTTVGAGPSVTEDVFGTGTVLDTLVGDLPYGFTFISSCSFYQNNYNDWAYFDFAPESCDQPITIRINGGNNFFLEEACTDPQLYGKDIPTQIFSDTIPPVLTVSDINISMLECGPANVESFGISVMDLCDPNPAITVSHLPGLFPPGTTTVTVTATDSAGLSSTETFDVTVTGDDSTPPVFDFVPPNMTVECDAVPAVGVPVISDACDPNPVVTFLGETITGQSCAGSYLITRSWEAVDSSGHSSTASQTITVQDTTAPSIAGVPLNITVQCDNVPGPAVLTAADNCDPNPVLSFDEVITPGSCAGSYTITRTWTALDDCGNSQIASQVITVEDTTAPALAGVPGDITVSPENVPLAASPTASDNCDSSPAVSLAEVITPGSCAGSYILTRTWTATDDCGNSSSAAQVVTVVDATAPVLAGVPADVTAECDSVPAPASPTATDNFDAAPVVSFLETITAGVCAGDYVLTRTWTATDECGNSSSAVQVVTVQDTTAPSIDIAASDLTIECDGAGNNAELTAWLDSSAGASASDLCGAVTWSHDFSVLSDECGATGSAIVTFTATDECGNASVNSATITIQDTTAPSLAGVPSNVTVQCDNVPGPAVLTAADNCDPNPVLSFDEIITPGACAGSYTITRTWTALDECGNSQIASQVITVEDPTAPALAGVPGDITVSPENVPLAASPTASDNCDSSPVVSLAEAITPGSCAGSYILTRTWTATDDCGNSSSAAQVVTVVDATAPVLVGVPADVTAECDSVPAPASPTATDNFDAAPVVSFLETIAAGVCAGDYVLTRTWTATDECGNSSSAVQVVTVQDTTGPSIDIAASDLAVGCDGDGNSAELTAWLASNGGASASDACSGVTWSNDFTSLVTAIDSNGMATVAFTATDACGNSSTTTATFTIDDTTDPVITLIGYDIQFVECPDPYVEEGATADDGCSGDLTAQIVIDSSEVNSTVPGTYEVSYTVVDGSGNSTTVIREVEVVDTTNPEISLNGDSVIVLLQGDPYVEESATVTDNCDQSVSVVIGGDVVDTSVTGVYTVTYDSTDSSGNDADQVTRTVTVLPRFVGLDALFGCSDLKAEQDAVVNGSVGSGNKVDLHSNSAVTGDVVNVNGNVDLKSTATVGGDIDAGGKVVLHNGASVGAGVISGEKIDLKKNASIGGDAISGGEVKLGNGASVGGVITENSPVTPLMEISLPVLALTTSGADVSINKNESATILPGGYLKLKAKEGATIALSGGHYTFNEIDVAKNSQVQLDVTAGPITIDVVGDADFDGVNMTVIGGTASDVLFQVQGKHAKLGTSNAGGSGSSKSGSSKGAGNSNKIGNYIGTYLVPSGKVTLEDGGVLTGAGVSTSSKIPL